MANRPTFTLPEGLELGLDGTSLSVRYDGPVELSHTMGRTLESVHADGDVTLSLDKTTGTVSGGGTVEITGNVDADVIHGRVVRLTGATIKCKAISATHRIEIGAAKLAVDCIIAPTIDIDGKASGRVTVIESHNERGPTKIKGGFGLADYDDMFGNAAEFLADRGLEPLGEAQDLDDEPEPEPEPEAASDAPTALEPEGHELPDDEEVEDPLSLSIDDIEELMEELEGNADSTEDSTVQPQLMSALSRIQSCYDGADLPPAVNELEHLIQQRDYEQLRSSITSVWTGLIGFHNKRGIRPNHKVTHAFNEIHEILQP